MLAAPNKGVYMFRDAIVELFETELQGRFTSRARSGMMSVLNYVGGVGDGWILLVLRVMVPSGKLT